MPDLSPGAVISHYRIQSRLGAGGMGEVYLATDLELDRPVALKILQREVANDPARLNRFAQEARSASALNHPNVAHIYEFRSAEGLPFLAMEYVEGETLRARIGTRPLPLNEILDIAAQVADALDAAHSKGIVHRDIKPANILITPRGQAKILDFGLAKLDPGAASSSSEIPTQAVTDPGLVMGTVQYMSPEQTMGQKVDGRSDIFSFGAVLYEMATGRAPFAGANAPEIMSRIAHSQPEAIARFNYDVPPELERIVRKCLEKERERRYQSAREIVIDLNNLRRDSSSGAAVAQPPQPSHRRWIFAAVAASLILAIGASAYFILAPGARVDSMAVLPLANANGDPNAEWLSDGITESLINNLSQISGLSVMSRSAVFQYKAKPADPQTAGKALHVQAVLTGRMMQRGDNLSISVELVNVHDNRHLWGEQYNRKLADIMALQDEISRDVAEKLRVQLRGQENPLRRPTENAAAYELYLKGRYHQFLYTPEAIAKSIDYYRQALEKDPRYARAWAGLSEDYIFQDYGGTAPSSELQPLAQAAARKALEIDDRLPEAHNASAISNAPGHWADSEKELRHSLELDPTNVDTYDWLSSVLICLKRHDDALAIIRKGIALDSNSIALNADLSMAYYFHRDYDHAIEAAQRLLDAHPGQWLLLMALGCSYAQKHDINRALEAFQQMRQALGDPVSAGYLGWGHAKAGKPDEARRLLREIDTMAKTRYVPPQAKALIYIGLGDKPNALALLEKMSQDHSSWLFWAPVEPILDPLRSEPQFQTVLHNLGF